MTALLALRDVDARYGARQVLHGVSLEVGEAGLVALLGANGAGKTTLLRAICQLEVRTRGELHYAGARLDRLSTEAIARRGVGHVPEGRGTFAGLSVEDNLALGALHRRDRRAVATDRERLFGYFPVLARRLHQQAGTLSGGEQQMLVIGRALMSDPQLLVLDEPSFGLAPKIVDKIFEVIVGFRATGLAVLLVEQNANIALQVSQRGYVIESGSCILHDDAGRLRDNPHVQSIYLGAA